MHKFYWNNKQQPRAGNNATVGQTATADTGFAKSRVVSQETDANDSVFTSTGKKGCVKMPYSKSEYNFDSAANMSNSDIGISKQPNAEVSKNALEDFIDDVNPQLPKRSDGGIRTVVRVTSSPAKDEDAASSKYRLTTSKSHFDMRQQIQSNNQRNVTSNSHENDQSTINNNTNATKSGKAPVGSHRVLLKLRRLSGRDSRPKSVHGAEQISMESGKGMNCGNKSSGDQSDSISLKGISSSKSMHQFNYFYNRTWNERSLQKYAPQNNSNSHNYENVYSGYQEDDDDMTSNSRHGADAFKAPPVYENITVASEYQLNAMISGNNPLVINRLACSPKSSVRMAGSRISIIPSDYVSDRNNSRDNKVQNANLNWASYNQQDSHTPIPPERKGRRNDRNAGVNVKGNNRDETTNYGSVYNDNSHRQLYRSKSCERPKMKDSVRDTFKLLSNETSDRLQTNFNRFSSNFTDKFLASNSIMNKFACGSNSGNGSTRSSNSSYNGKSSHSSKMSTGSSSDSSKYSSNVSSTYDSTNENALHTTNRQSVGITNFIPSIDAQVRNNKHDLFIKLHFIV